MNSPEGLDFLKKKYDLHNAPEVKEAAERINKKEDLKIKASKSLKKGIKKFFSHEEEKPEEIEKTEFKTPEALIENYLERFSEILERKDEKKKYHGLDALKRLLDSKFVIKENEIPESYWEFQKRLALEQGHGEVEITDEQKEQLSDVIIEDQKTSLNLWIDYLTSTNAPFPDWLKYFAMRNVFSMSSYNIEKKSFGKRAKGTVQPFPDLNEEALGYVFEALEQKYKKKEDKKLEENHQHYENEKEFQDLLKAESFPKLYAFAYEKVIPTSKEDLSNVAGEWIKYDRGSKPTALVESLQGKKTGWCTAGERTAGHQLERGDFYVFYSNDAERKPTFPRVAIRMDGNRIGEVRGVATGQNLDQQIVPVVEKKLEEFHDGKIYKKRIADMKELTRIYNKNRNKETLTREELSFLYEEKGTIQGFGFGERTDPRIAIIKKERDKISDYSIIFDCPKECISDKPETVTEDTKVFIGKLRKWIDIYSNDSEEERSIKRNDYKILNNRKNPIIIYASIDLHSTPIALLPDEITFKFDADFANCKLLASLPKKITVLGDADFSGTGISTIPSSAKFEKSVSFRQSKLLFIPAGMTFKGDADFAGTPLISIPRNTIFMGKADFNSTQISSIPANVEFRGKVVFQNCKKLESIPASSLFEDSANFVGTGLKFFPEHAVFNGKALFDNCKALKNISETARFNNFVSFKGSGLTSIPMNAEFNGDLDLEDCKSLKTIPVRTFNHKVKFNSSGITEVPKGVIFNERVSFYRCDSLTSISKEAVFNQSVDFRGCENLKSLPENIIFNVPVDFGYCASLLQIPRGAVFNGKTGFQNCLSLRLISKGVVFNDNVDFSDCPSLNEIPMETIFNGDANFVGCKTLTNLTKEMLKKMKKEGKIKGELKL